VIQALLQDVRYALRLLHRSPGFAATAIATLAVAIGANAAIFSAVKGVLIAPLPYPAPDRLVRVFEESARTPHFPMAPADFRDYRAELRTFEGLAAYFRSDLQLGDVSRPEQLRGMQVTAGFFRLLGHPPILGREFEEHDEIEGNHLVAILSHALWMRRFDGDPAIVGRPLRLSGRTYTVIGVLPDGFAHVGGTYRTYGHGEPVDVWSVLAVPRDEHPRHRFSHYYNVVGRIREGASWSVMENDLRRTGKIVAARYPTPNSPWSPRVVPLKQEIVGNAESTLIALAAATAGVLLLACVNVAGLLLGRAAARTREVGVRAALGATRARIARQLVVESVVLALAGGTVGIILAFGGVALATRFGPADMPRLHMIAVDGQVLASTLAATLATALLFGLAPAVRLSATGIEAALREGGRTVAGFAHNRLRRTLAAAEVALAFVLVVASALLLRSFVAMISTDPGFVAESTLTASIELPSAKYDRATATAFFRRALERVAALPGVSAAAFSADLPWSGYDENTGFELVGRPPSDDGRPKPSARA
jgi:putative ABC transport system permease protein